MTEVPSPPGATSSQPQLISSSHRRTTCFGLFSACQYDLGFTRSLSLRQRGRRLSPSQANHSELSCPGPRRPRLPDGVAVSTMLVLIATSALPTCCGTPASKTMDLPPQALSVPNILDTGLPNELSSGDTNACKHNLQFFILTA